MRKKLKTLFINALKKINIHSLRTKIFIICMVITNVTVFIIASAITQQASKIIAGNAYDYIYESMRHADDNFDIFLEDALSLSIAIASNKEIIINALLDDSRPASYQAFELQKKADAYLESMVSNKSHILLVSAIALDGKNYKSSGSLILKSVTQEPWFTQASAESRVRLFYNTPDEKRIALCRPIRYNGQLLGVALVEMDYEILDNIYSITPLQNAQISTFSEEGSLVFSNYDMGNINNIADTPLKELLEQYDENENTYNINGKEILVAKHTSELSGLTTIGLVSYDDLLTEALSFRTQSVTIILFSLIAATLVAWLFARYISRNIYLLQTSMIKISEGDINSRAHIASKDEIGVMGGIFNAMMDRILFLMKDIREKEEQKRKAEQDALETQIQPHFIYNTINSISYVAHMRGEKELEEVSIATVELLRGMLGVRASFIPLWQECEYINQYLKVQKFKMQKQFSVLWNVEPQLWLYKIPKLLIQPIVENSLIHGVADMDNGQIDVQVSLHDDKVLIRVTDNGKGISKDTLDLMNQKKPSYYQFRTVGFANVKDRVKAIYGEPYDVHISSVKGAFTSVEIILPFLCPDDSEATKPYTQGLDKRVKGDEAACTE